MISRTYDVDLVLSCTNPYPDLIGNTDMTEWINDRRNIVFTDGINVVCLERRKEGCFVAHYFFKDRGKKAINVLKEMVDEAFTNDAYDIRVIMGFTPEDKPGALWMTRHLGWNILGEEDIDGVRHHVSVLTKKEYMNGLDLRR